LNKHSRYNLYKEKGSIWDTREEYEMDMDVYMDEEYNRIISAADMTKQASEKLQKALEGIMLQGVGRKPKLIANNRRLGC
jgi:hypothetical protein